MKWLTQGLKKLKFYFFDASPRYFPGKENEKHLGNLKGIGWSPKYGTNKPEEQQLVC